jgi:hypothetical protein
VKDVVAAVASAVAIVAFLLTAAGGTVSAYRRTIGSRRDLRRRLDDLACGVTREHVERVLGPPTFRRARGDMWVERVYWKQHAWVQVFFDADDAVAVLSLTVVDPRFGYRADAWTVDATRIVVGRSRLPICQMRPLAGRRGVATSTAQIV